MADEPLPKPDGIVPGPTGPKPPLPTFSQDVVHAGTPPALPPSQAVTPPAALPPTLQAVKPARDAKANVPNVAGPQRSELGLFFSWLAGVVLIIGAGWGEIALLSYLARNLHLGIAIEIVSLVAGAVSFFLLFMLERNLWLSRFMGLRLGPHSTPLKETLYFFFLGIVGLLLRSSDSPAPVQTRAPQENDGTREIIETVVFVIVLVLLLRTFLVEAFVIPTGSMADTLLGYHKEFTCDKCHRPFLVNASGEAEPQPDRGLEFIVGGICPNCQWPHRQH